MDDTPDRADQVQEIFIRFVAGESFSSIAGWLNAEQIPTATGEGKWYPAGVRYILSNGFYAGLSQWDGVEVQGAHPAIINKALYEAAHQRIQSMKPGPQRQPTE